VPAWLACRRHEAVVRAHPARRHGSGEAIRALALCSRPAAPSGSCPRQRPRLLLRPARAGPSPGPAAEDQGDSQPPRRHRAGHRCPLSAITWTSAAEARRPRDGTHRSGRPSRCLVDYPNRCGR